MYDSIALSVSAGAFILVQPPPVTLGLASYLGVRRLFYCRIDTVPAISSARHVIVGANIELELYSSPVYRHVDGFLSAC